jgi:hypothetical protein
MGLGFDIAVMCIILTELANSDSHRFGVLNYAMDPIANWKFVPEISSLVG